MKPRSTRFSRRAALRSLGLGSLAVALSTSSAEQLPPGAAPFLPPHVVPLPTWSYRTACS